MKGIPVYEHLGASCRVLFAALFAVALPAQADPEPGEKIPVYDVYVTSQRDIVQKTTTVREITRETIQEKNARNLNEALQREPSIVIRRAGQGVPRLDLRGLRTRQVLLLVDGVPSYSTEDGNFDPSLIPSNLIESIDVTYSNSSVLYGDGPLAGVLQVRTRSGKQGVQAEGRGDFREGMQYLGQASVSGAAGGFEGFASGSYEYAEGFNMSDDFDPTPLEDGGRRENSDREMGTAFAKLGYAPNERGRVDVLFDYRRMEYGIPWAVYDNSDPYGRNPNYQRLEDLEGFSGQLSGQLLPHEDVELRSWAYVARQTQDRGRYDDENLNSIDDRNSYLIDDTALITGGALHGRYDMGDYGALRFAANGRYESFEADGWVRLRSGDLGEVDQSEGLGAWSLGLEYEVQPVDSAGLVLGYGHAFLEGDGIGDNGSLFLAGAYYDFDTGTRLRGSAAHKLRFPSIRQLYEPDYGNSDLDSERCWCFDVAIEQRLPRNTTLALTGYWLELKDFIERPPGEDFVTNHEEWRNRGFEVTAESRPWQPLFVRLAYTYLDARDLSSDSIYDRLENRPRHKIDFVSVATLPWQMDFRVGFSWPLNTLTYSRDGQDSRELDDFVLLDLKLEQRLWEDLLRLYVGVDNLLDEDWTFNYGFPQEGRAVYGGLELRY